MSRRRRVALIVETSGAYGRQILRGVRRYVRTHQTWSIFLEQRSLSTEPPGWLQDWDGDGIISRATTAALAAAAVRTGVPVIDLTDRHGTFGLPQVWSDDLAIARLGADHLLERGFRRFGFCGFSRESWSSRRRDEFVSTLAGQGFECRVHESTWFGDGAGTWEQEQGRVMDWLDALPKPAGVMACNDFRGQHVLDACSRLDLAVPEQVAVIGVDNEEELCELCDPPLSSVTPNAELVGYKAAAMLDLLMSGGRPEPRHELVAPTGVVTRQSTDVLAIDEPDVAAAVRYIRENACRGMNVDDIMATVPVSRSVLERKFRKYLDRSPQTVIRQVQMKRVCELLVKTDLPLTTISGLAGFKHNEHMCIAFKREFGQTPGTFRKKARG